MTIDEFKKKIAPHMKKGFVAMDKDGSWRYQGMQPCLNEDYGEWEIANTMSCLDDAFYIEPVEDWTQSLIEVGR